MNRYRRSISIDRRYRFTYLKTRSISTVDIDPPTGEYGWYWRPMPIHPRNAENYGRSMIVKNIEIILCLDKILKHFFLGEVKKGPLTMVPEVVKNCPKHPSTNNSMVPWLVRNGQNTFPNIDTYPLIYRQVDLSRCMSMVDTNSPTENYSWSSTVD